MQILKSLLILILFTGLLSACQSSEVELAAPPSGLQTRGSTFTETPCRMSAPFGIKLTCGTVEVPFNTNRPAGDKIKLTVAIAHSKAKQPQPDPVVFLPVSPGTSSLELMDWVTQSMGLILRERDMIFYDPRGVEHSEPVLPECPEVINWYTQVLGVEVANEEQIQAVVDSYLACRNLAIQAGFDLTNYTLDQHVADLNAIRVGMGYQQVNLLGTGFAHELALRLLRESSEGVRSVAVLSAEDIQVNYSQMSTSLERALNLVFQRCQANESCSRAYPELAEEYYRSIDQYNQQPTPITIYRRGQAEGFEFNLSGFLMIELSRLLLQSSEGIAALPNIIHEIFQERTATLDDSIWWMAMRYGFSHVAADFSAECPAVLSLDEQNQLSGDANPLLKQEHLLTLQFIGRVCQEWYGKPVQPALPLQSFADTPFLVLQGAYDPSLPADLIRRELQEMSAARVIEMPNQGGNIDWGQSCASRMVSDFLQDPSLELNTSCLEDIPPVLFVLPGQ